MHRQGVQGCKAAFASSAVLQLRTKQQHNASGQGANNMQTLLWLPWSLSHCFGVRRQPHRLRHEAAGAALPPQL